MSSGRAFNVAIVGATGAVGQTMLAILEERLFPVKNLSLLASSRSAGKEIIFKGEKLRVHELTKDSFKGIDIALFSAGGSRSLEYAPSAAQSGAVVIDNTSAFRMDPEVPLVVPEVNANDIALYRKRGIIANPNCTTIIFIVPLKPLNDAFRAKRVVISSYQAVSGAGAKAIEELKDQTLAFTRGSGLKQLHSSVFPYPIAFNLIPHIDAFLDNGYTKEEMKAHNETRKMLNNDSLAVSATCVRVPIFRAHSIAVYAEFERPVDPQKAREILENAPFVKIVDNPKEKLYPMPLYAANMDACFVGRIRKDNSHPNALSFFVAGDQLRKGAALNAIQIAEILVDSYL